VLPALPSRRAHSSSRAATPALVVTARKALTCLGECCCEYALAIKCLLTYGYRLISALAITPAGAYFLWPSAHGDDHHGHEEHHEEHHEEAEAKEEEQPQEEESKDEEPKEEQPKEEESKGEKPKVEDKSESEKAEKPSGTEGESQDRADGNKKSSGNEEAEERAPTSGPASTEGASGKGHMKSDSEGHNQTSKREPDGKGGFKNRKDSGLQKDLTPTAEGSNSVSFFVSSQFNSDRAAFKVTNNFLQGDISNKQAGMSNTQTRHSIPIHESNEKSKKSEGGPDTAKTQGTIDPNRPAV
jgi:hypothetical protein